MNNPDDASRRVGTARILDSAGRGRRTALGEVVEKVDDLIAAIVRHHLGPRRRVEDEEDLRQEIRFAVTQRIRDLRRRDREALRAWVRKVANSRIIDWERRRKAQRRSPGAALLRLDATHSPEVRSPGPTPSYEAMSAEERERVEHALDSVKPKYRPVLQLLYREAPDLDELAEFLGKGRESARKHVARAMRELKRAIRSPGDG